MMTDRIAPNLRRFREGVFRHDELNPSHTAWGVGLAYHDMQRLGFEEGEELWTGITIHADGGQASNFRVLCDAEHDGEGTAHVAQVEKPTHAVGVEA